MVLPPPPASFPRGKPNRPPDRPYADWLAEVSPELRWDWPHLRLIQRTLDRVTAGELKRVAFFMPPQHGKSECVTVRYPAYRLERDPTTRVIVGGYSQRHANKFSRKTRKLTRPRVELSAERKAVGEWETLAGGGYLAVGVGAGVTGNPGDLIILDDPIKSREEAESEAYRDRVWDWYRDDVYTRKSKDAAIVVIFTRWHEDDLWGRLSGLPNAAEWEVIVLRAEAEADDPLARPLGAALCPDLHPLMELIDNRLTNPGSYEALYQQRPTRREGELLKRHWFVRVRAVPRQAQRVRYWDKAGTAGDGAFSCGVLLARTPDGLFWIEDVQRGQWSINERNARVRETARMDKIRFGHVTTWTEQEPGSGGKESAEITVRQLAGFSVKVDPVRHDKMVRCLPFADQAEAGNVRVMEAEWTEAYLSELASFPRGKNRDQVDATSGGFNKLTLQPVAGPIGLPSGHGNVLDDLPKGVFG